MCAWIACSILSTLTLSAGGFCAANPTDGARTPASTSAAERSRVFTGGFDTVALLLGMLGVLGLVRLRGGGRGAHLALEAVRRIAGGRLVHRGGLEHPLLDRAVPHHRLALGVGRGRGER